MRDYPFGETWRVCWIIALGTELVAIPAAVIEGKWWLVLVPILTMVPPYLIVTFAEWSLERATRSDAK